MSGRRLDLAPEPEEATETGAEQRGKIEQGWTATQASFARFSQSMTVRVPAAGRLGVQEVQCGYLQDGFHERQFATEFGAVNRCPFCFAEV